MSEQAKIIDPAALDLATVEQLVGELHKRHHSILVCLFPLAANNGAQKPVFYTYGNYYLNLSMAMNAADLLRANNPLVQRGPT